MFSGREHPPPFRLALSPLVRGRPANAGATPFDPYELRLSQRRFFMKLQYLFQI